MERSDVIKAGRLLKGYMVYPVVVGIILLAAIVPAFMFSTKSGFAAVIVFVAFAIATLIFFLVSRKKFFDSLMNFVRGYGLMENRMIEVLPIPYAITDKTGNVFLYNSRFAGIYNSAAAFQQAVSGRGKGERRAPFDPRGRSVYLCCLYDRRDRDSQYDAQDLRQPGGCMQHHGG